MERGERDSNQALLINPLTRDDQPSRRLAEVCGLGTNNNSQEALTLWKDQTCKFTGSTCSKVNNKKIIPACSVIANNKMHITCPTRFDEVKKDFLQRAASYCLGPDASNWKSRSEVTLKDADGERVGNIDQMVFTTDGKEGENNLGFIELQTVYISGNVGDGCSSFLASQSHGDAPIKARPDYRSSTKKRLIPQLIEKGQIAQQWGAKMAVVVQDTFFEEIPNSATGHTEEDSDIIWLIYQAKQSGSDWNLKYLKPAYSTFASIATVTTHKAGNLDDFMESLRQ